MKIIIILIFQPHFNTTHFVFNLESARQKLYQSYSTVTVVFYIVIIY